MKRLTNFFIIHLACATQRPPTNSLLHVSIFYIQFPKLCYFIFFYLCWFLPFEHYVAGNVACKTDVERVLRGADCVFHMASYGMSGKEMLQYGRVDEVNINGTCHVLEACLDYGIKRLVYVSTYNVVFAGKEIVNGDETLPYFPMDDHVDPYGRSKSIAEQLVLKSNGRPFK